MRCEATTHGNRRCANDARAGSTYCWVHREYSASKPGRRRPQPPSPAPAPAEPLPQVLAEAATPARPQPPSHSSELPESEPAFAALAAALAAAGTPEAAGEPSRNGKSERLAPSPTALSKAMHSAGYGIGYSLAFPTFLLLGMVPDNALFRGFQEGVDAARDTVERMQKR